MTIRERCLTAWTAAKTRLSDATATGNRRVILPVAFVTVSAIAVGGTTVYALNDTTAEVIIDGQSQSVRFFGRTVDKALDKAGVTVGKNDVVEPALGSPIHDGGSIKVTHARPLHLVVDGKETEHTVAATTVGEALDLLDVRAANSQVSVSRSVPIGREGLKVELITPKNFTVTVDGSDQNHTSNARTVADALKGVNVPLNELDIVNPVRESALTADAKIQIVRVVHEEIKKVEPIAFDRKTEKTNDLPKGERKVTTKGKKGTREVTERIIKHDGREVERLRVHEHVSVAPVTEVTALGTAAPKPEPAKPEPAKPGKPKPAKPTKPAPAVGKGVWDRLAQCESGGNWKINTGNGYYGGLQFSARSWRAVGGTGLPHQHSRETQIQMGKRLKAKQGWGAWPACSRKLGLR